MSQSRVELERAMREHSGYNPERILSGEHSSNRAQRRAARKALRSYPVWVKETPSGTVTGRGSQIISVEGAETGRV